jgi:WD40 repeat protein/serine/threonine protein kinase/DNA-binding SARP family transcriptional activator
MAQLNIFMLGSFRATQGNGQALQFKSAKDRALLAYLAVEADRAHHRDTLATLLWPEMPDSAARSNLRYTLSSLRRTIGDRNASPPYLHIDQEAIQCNLASTLWVDVIALRDGLRQAQLFDNEKVEAAAALYHGPFLEGFSLNECPEFESWLMLQREQINHLVLEALGRLATHYERGHEYERAIDFVRRQVSLEPWDEAAQRQLMRLLAFNGQRSEALAQYTALCETLHIEFDVEPEPDTERLVEQIRADTLRPELDMMSGRPIRGYELGEFIGAGHMGTVYRAYQPGVGRNVAIKIIQAGYADRPIFIQRFELEARLVARLEHPYIVPLYDFWREPGSAFLVMRWLQGGCLADSLAEGPWAVESAVRLILQIASALQVAHQNGVIHRDIKPANILLDEVKNGYLSDFGIATLVEPHPKWEAVVAENLTGDTPGSLGYTSPELLAGAQPTAAADIYSLGVVLFELLTGRNPFLDVPAPDLIQKHLSEPLPPLQTMRPDLPAEMNEVIQCATAKRPEERYIDALALAHAFQQAVKPSASFIIDTAWDSLPLHNPYKGLRAFEEADEAEFFGRTALIEHLLCRIDTAGPFARFLALVGPSGSGKSSLLRAGLLPRLRQGALPGSTQWYSVTILPGSHPFEELALGLLQISAKAQPDLAGRLRQGEQSLLEVIDDLLPPGAELLLVVDQFEELYTEAVEPFEQEQFLHCLYTAVTGTSSHLRVLIGLRADFYDRPLLHPAFSRLLQQRTEVLVPLTMEELTAAIEEPVQRVGVSLEDGLTAQLVADVNQQPGALPLLQYALTELFEHRTERLLTYSAYAAIGGVAGALAQRAEATYLSLDQATQSAARQIFLRLVSLGESSEPTRRRVLQAELADLVGQDQQETVLDLFGQYRLLTYDRDPVTRQPTVEVAHEALLREWGRFSDWLDESRADLRLQRLLANAASEWSNAQQDSSYLMHGARLAQLEDWEQKTNLALTKAEKEFLNASLMERERMRAAEAERQAHETLLERRSRNRLRAIAILMATAALVASLLSIFAIRQRQAALEAYSLSLTANAQTALKSGDSATALVLALAATDINNPPLLSRQTLLDAAYAPGARQHYEVDALFPGVHGPATALALAPDERTLFIGLSDGTVISWDWVTQAETGRYAAHTAPVDALAVSQDGNILLGAAEDGLVTEWDLRTGELLQRLVGHSGPVRAVDITQDGRYAVSGGFSGFAANAFDTPGELYLWDLLSGKLIQRFEGHLKGVIQAKFVLDDTAILASSGDLELITDLGGTPEAGVLSDVILWDLASDKPRSTLNSLGHDISAIAQIPGSPLVLLGSYYDNMATLFNLETGQPMLILSGNKDAVLAVAVAADGKRALTSAQDGTLILWNLENGETLAHLKVDNEAVTDITASPDFRTAFSISRSGELVRWDLYDAMQVRRFTGHGDMVWDVAVMPDGKRLVSVSGAPSPAVPSRDTSLRIWDIATGDQLGMVALPIPVIFQVAVAPDSSLIMADSRLFDAGTLAEIGQVSGHAEGAWIPAIDISPDGKQALTAGTDGVLILWDLASRTPIRRIQTGEQSPLWAVSFSPDGHNALADSSTSLLDLWDLTSATRLRGYLPEGFTSSMGSTAAVFHPDGKSVLAAAHNGFIYRFDLESGDLLQTYGPHINIRTRVEISPDGALMLTSGMDGTLMLWDMTTGNLIRRFGTPGDTIFDITLDEAGRMAFSGSADGSIVQWELSNPSLDELRTWIAANRFVRDLTCEEQNLFQIEPGPRDACAPLAGSR